MSEILSVHLADPDTAYLVFHRDEGGWQVGEVTYPGAVQLANVWRLDERDAKLEAKARERIDVILDLTTRRRPSAVAVQSAARLLAAIWLVSADFDVTDDDWRGSTHVQLSQACLDVVETVERRRMWQAGL